MSVSSVYLDLEGPTTPSTVVYIPDIDTSMIFIFLLRNSFVFTMNLSLFFFSFSADIKGRECGPADRHWLPIVLHPTNRTSTDTDSSRRHGPGFCRTEAQENLRISHINNNDHSKSLTQAFELSNALFSSAGSQSPYSPARWQNPGCHVGAFRPL